jgi:hypothetical protein
VSEVQLAPFALLRVAGLPRELLAELRVPELERQLTQLREAERELADLREPLCDQLYRALPALPDASARRRLLALRRALHNGRALELSEHDRAVLVLDDPALLTRALAASARAQNANDVLRAQYERWLADTARPALHRLVRAEAFLCALHAATPPLCEQVLAGALHELRGKRLRQLERALLRYLIRAATKTSPFATFMHIAQLALSAQGAGSRVDARAAQLQPSTRLERGVLTALHHAYRLDPARDTAARYRRVESAIREPSGALLVASAEYVEVHSHLWRATRPKRLRLVPAARDVLLEQEALHGDAWRRRLVAAGLAPERASSLLRELIRQGVLLPELPWDGATVAPEQTWLRQLAETDSPAARELHATVDALVTAAAQLARASAAERVRARARIEQLQDHALTRLAPHALPKLRNPISEHGWLRGVRGELGGELARAIQKVARLLAERAALTPLYSLLVRSFEHKFAGGVCRDVAGFMRAFCAQLPDTSAQLAALLEREQRAPVDYRGGALGMTLQLQLSEHPEQWDPARSLIVVNQGHERLGWLSARYALHEAPCEAALAPTLAGWLREAYAPHEPIEIFYNGDCDNAQAHPLLTTRALLCGDESRGSLGSRALTPRDLQLRIDPTTGLLALSDGGERRLAPVSLGSVAPTLLAAPLPYLLSLIGEPFACPRPRLEQLLGADARRDVEHMPRVQVDNVVFIRASWWVRSQSLAAAAFGGRAHEQLSAVVRWFEQHGIPLACYVRGLAGSARGERSFERGRGRKPQYIDVRAPLCLELLRSMVSEHEALALSEALPAPERAWLVRDGQHYVSELQVEVVVPLTRSRIAVTQSA